MKHTIHNEIPSYLCDSADVMHTWAAVRLCQEVSEYHANKLGVGFNSLIDNNLAWVIVRSYYELLRRPRAFEPVELNTWARGNDGLFAFRDYSMFDAEGKELLRGTSYWTLIDYTQRRAVRLKDHIQAYTVVDECATERQSLDRLRVAPFADEDRAFSMTTRHSMIDHTNHVNNSEYIKWIFDALHEQGFDETRPFSVELNFQHETKPGDTVAVYVRRDDERTYSAQVTNSTGLSALAKINFLS